MAWLQDIHSADISLWTTLQTYWADGNYTAALALLENNDAQLANKYLTAAWLNALAEEIVAVENNSDSTFKMDKISVASTAPSLSTGQVYFQLD